MILNRYEYSKIKNNNLPDTWKSQRSLDDLQDFLQENWEQRTVFYEDKEIDTTQQFLKFGDRGSITTSKYIGTVAFKGEQLNIYPKVFREDKDDDDTSELNQKHLLNNLVKWIEYCNKINYPFINISSELNDSEDLRELFITLYIGYVRKAIERNLYYQYIEETEDCTSIKGKFHVDDYILKKIPNAQGNLFNCSYSKFEFDNKVNRIIKYTCKQLLKLDTSVKNQKNLRMILTKLNEISDVVCTPRDCENIRLGKMNRHYEIIISMSKMFLLNKTSNYSFDINDSFCFLFPADMLFEGFVGGFLKEVISGYGGSAKLQENKASLIDKMVYDGKTSGAAFKLRHDILAEYNDKIFILDTKYKEISRFEDNPNYLDDILSEVDQSDLYQVLEYARKRNLNDVYLLYPMYRYEQAEKEFPYGINENPTGNINVHFIRLPFVFEENEEETKEQLKGTIKQIFAIK